MDVREVLTPQILQNAILIMQKADLKGDQAYVYVQTAEALKLGIRALQAPAEPAAKETETTDGDHGEATDE